MITCEKHDELVLEFKEHGELSNNIKLLHYGVILLQSMKRLECNLTELLDAINEASQKQIDEYKLGKSFL